MISRRAGARRRHRDLRRRAGWARRSRACCWTAASACASSRAGRSGRARWPRSCRRRGCSTPTAFDPEFFERERIGRATAAVFALNDDPGNLFSAVLAKAHGVQLTIALAHDQSSLQGLRARRRRRRHQPAPGDRRGARALRPRPAHPPDRDARRRPLRDPRPDACAATPSWPTRASTSCPRPAR